MRRPVLGAARRPACPGRCVTVCGKTVRARETEESCTTVVSASRFVLVLAVSSGQMSVVVCTPRCPFAAAVGSRATVLLPLRRRRELGKKWESEKTLSALLRSYA